VLLGAAVELVRQEIRSLTSHRFLMGSTGKSGADPRLCPLRRSPQAQRPFGNEPGGPIESMGPPVPLHLAELTPQRRELATAAYFLGHGALYRVVTVSPVLNVSSDFSGKPPFGHFVGMVP